MGVEKERRNRPCPATKRNGELCGSKIVSISGYCFAHDPESAAWRAKGGRESSNRRRVRKRMRETGLGKVLDSLEETMEQLRLGEANVEEARTKARVAEAILKLVNWAESDAKAEAKDEDGLTWPTKWEPY